MARKEDDMAQYKYQLDEKDIPTQWYNVLADLPSPLPPLTPSPAPCYTTCHNRIIIGCERE